MHYLDRSTSASNEVSLTGYLIHDLFSVNVTKYVSFVHAMLLDIYARYLSEKKKIETFVVILDAIL